MKVWHDKKKCDTNSFDMFWTFNDAIIERHLTHSCSVSLFISLFINRIKQSLLSIVHCTSVHSSVMHYVYHYLSTNFTKPSGFMCACCAVFRLGPRLLGNFHPSQFFFAAFFTMRFRYRDFEYFCFSLFH